MTLQRHFVALCNNVYEKGKPRYAALAIRLNFLLLAGSYAFQMLWAWLLCIFFVPLCFHHAMSALHSMYCVVSAAANTTKWWLHLASYIDIWWQYKIVIQVLSYRLQVSLTLPTNTTCYFWIALRCQNNWSSTKKHNGQPVQQRMDIMQCLEDTETAELLANQDKEVSHTWNACISSYRGALLVGRPHNYRYTSADKLWMRFQSCWCSAELSFVLEWTKSDIGRQCFEHNCGIPMKPDVTPRDICA